MPNSKIEKEIAEIIKNYREDSIKIVFDQKHVHKWVSQFSTDTQNVILEEILYIFKEWYFDKVKIWLFLEEVTNFLKKENQKATKENPFNEICFLDIQERGKSQTQLVEMLREMVRNKYNVNIKTGKSGEEKYYVYIDDGLYTGSRLRKDVSECIDKIPEGARIDAFFLVSCLNGMVFSEQELKKVCSHKNIEIKVYPWRVILNDKTIRWHQDGYSYSKVHECLWPSCQTSMVPEINAFLEHIENIKGEKLNYAYRNIHTEGIFTNLKNRNIVEVEFLSKGIMITKKVQKHKGLYPLGYNNTLSFGFGSICSTDLNISNTCPLVLWWGNLMKQGNVMDCWYPLLPRRINNKDENPLGNA